VKAVPQRQMMWRDGSYPCALLYRLDYAQPDDSSGLFGIKALE